MRYEPGRRLPRRATSGPGALADEAPTHGTAGDETRWHAGTARQRPCSPACAGLEAISGSLDVDLGGLLSIKNVVITLNGDVVTTGG